MRLGGEDLVLALLGRQVSVVAVAGEEVVNVVQNEQPGADALEQLRKRLRAARPARPVREQRVAGEQVRPEREACRAVRGVRE